VHGLRATTSDGSGLARIPRPRTGRTTREAIALRRVLTRRLASTSPQSSGGSAQRLLVPFRGASAGTSARLESDLPKERYHQLTCSPPCSADAEGRLRSFRLATRDRRRTGPITQCVLVAREPCRNTPPFLLLAPLDRRVLRA